MDRSVHAHRTDTFIYVFAAQISRTYQGVECTMRFTIALLRLLLLLFIVLAIETSIEHIFYNPVINIQLVVIWRVFTTIVCRSCFSFYSFSSHSRARLTHLWKRCCTQVPMHTCAGALPITSTNSTAHEHNLRSSRSILSGDYNFLFLASTSTSLQSH